MTEGIIDLKIVGERLDIVRPATGELRALPSDSLSEFLADRRNIWAADALLRRAIEALFDGTRHVLAKAHGRGGLECREVAKLAAAHGLVSGDTPLVKIAGCRNRRAHHYDDVTPEELYDVVRGHLAENDQVAEEIRQSAAGLAARA